MFVCLNFKMTKPQPGEQGPSKVVKLNLKEDTPEEPVKNECLKDTLL